MKLLKYLTSLILLLFGLTGCFLVPNGTLEWQLINNPMPSPLPSGNQNTGNYPESLSITSLNQSSSFFAGGTSILLYGTGFTNTTTVKINNVNCESLDLISEMTLECVTPFFGIGTYELQATDGSQTSSTWAISYLIDYLTSIQTILGTTANPIGLVSQVAVDSSDNFYILDQTNSVIRKSVLGSDVSSVIVGSGNHTTSDGTGLGASFTSLNSIVYNASLNLFFIADENTIRTLNPTTLVVSTVYGSPATSVSGDGTGTSATFAVVNNLVFNPTDTTLFVSDNNLVRIIDVATQAVQTLAGMSGVFTSQDSTDGTGATASFSSVKSIVFDNGELYVVDGNNLRIMSSTTGDTNTLIHSASAGYANGPATSALLNSPTGLTFDGYNTLYIADSGNNAVRKLDLDTNTVSTVLGGPGYTGNDDGLLTVAQMANPQSVYFLNAGSASGLFVGNSSYFKIIH